MNDTTYLETLHAPLVRLRICIDAPRHSLDAFYVQLELNHAPGPDRKDEWKDIARFDHQPNAERGHDIAREGLHMDVKHPSEGDRKVTDFPDVRIERAPDYCKEYFKSNYLAICGRYITWADLPIRPWLPVKAFT